MVTVILPEKHLRKKLQILISSRPAFLHLTRHSDLLRLQQKARVTKTNENCTPSVSSRCSTQPTGKCTWTPTQSSSWWWVSTAVSTTLSPSWSTSPSGTMTFWLDAGPPRTTASGPRSGRTQLRSISTCSRTTTP